MVKLKKTAQFFAFWGRVHNFSIALIVENASLTAIVTWLVVIFNFSLM